MKASPPSRAAGLLDAARQDRPTAAQRSRIWEQVSLAPHLVVVSPLAVQAARNSVAPAANTAKAVTAGLSASKMLIAGALLGSALTVGALTAALLFVRSPERELAPLARLLPHQPAPGTASVEVAGDVAPPSRQPETADEPPPPTPRTASRDDAPARTSRGSAVIELGPTRGELERGTRTRRAASPIEASADDLLLHEAGLVSQARTAIRQGRPADALESLDAAARDSSHSLVPEELSLRVRALRLLGRDAEAERVSEVLKQRYPGNLLLDK